MAKWRQPIRQNDLKTHDMAKLGGDFTFIGQIYPLYEVSAIYFEFIII